MTVTDYLNLIPLVISVCAAIAAITPNKYDNQIVDAIRKIVDLGGLNFWYAKNQK